MTCHTNYYKTYFIPNTAPPTLAGTRGVPAPGEFSAVRHYHCLSIPHPLRNVDLLCSVKYKNNLPDVPFGPKFLSYPFDSQRYIQCIPPSPLSLSLSFEVTVVSTHLIMYGSQ